MSTSIDDIVELYGQRRQYMHPIHEQMRQVRDVYTARIALPLPELDVNEKAAVTNLLKQGVDGTAQRVTSTLPSIYCPPEKPGQKTSEKNADIRRRAYYSWWESNDMPTILARRARQFIAYSMAPVILRPDDSAHGGTPRWEVRDPLSCYPNPSARMDSIEPRNAIFTYTRPLSFLQRHYPDAASRVYVGKNAGPDTMFDLLEYLDRDEFVHVLMGQRRDPYDYNPTGAPYAELDRIPNKAGVCPVVIPSRITLDKPQGQFDGLIPMYYKQAKLDALEYIAIEQGVFPRQWLVGNPGETPQVVTMADGRKGIIGVVKGGQIHDESLNPGYKTTQAIDRLAGEQRLEGNVPAEMQGESGTNIRTGRRGDQVLANGIDYGIQETQRRFEHSLAVENAIGAEIVKAWFGDQPHSFYVTWKGAKGPVDYVPNDVFTTRHNTVKYALAGSDLNAQTVRTGQKLGEGLISKRTARATDPEIDDPDAEEHFIVTEQVETAFLQGFSQQVASGAVALADAASFLKKVRDQKLDPVEAFEIVQQEAQQRQSATVQPAQPGAPEAQPGIQGGPPGAPAGVAIPPPGPSQQNLAQVLAMAGQARGQMRAS